jgi:hypothetical protein
VSSSSAEDQFLYRENGEDFVRIPISCLLKLSLAELVGSQNRIPALIRNTAIGLMPRFLNDNTSPETYSFHVVRPFAAKSIGNGLARETAKRFLLSQLLVMYGNRHFDLLGHGQKAMVYFAPHPPVRQRDLKESISDSFYRELFMSPCLSGWNRGEEKHAYMNLCHQVLSRSQLNAVSKLREAGIIANNLVVLPNTSNISLANNGTHVSLGSRRLTEARRQENPAFGAAEEKLVGDLTIKIFEHCHSHRGCRRYCESDARTPFCQPAHKLRLRSGLLPLVGNGKRHTVGQSHSQLGDSHGA